MKAFVPGNEVNGGSVPILGSLAAKLEHNFGSLVAASAEDVDKGRRLSSPRGTGRRLSSPRGTERQLLLALDQLVSRDS